MSTWSVYFKGQAKKESVRQVTYVSGSESVLVQWCVEHVTRLIGPQPWNYITYVAGEDSERDIWAEIERHPLDRSFRIVVIRDFEKLRHVDRLISWMDNSKRTNPKTYLLLVDSAERAPTVPDPEDSRKQVAAPHIAAIARGGRGHVIECRPFTQATAQYAVAWVRRMQFMQENVAVHLLNRAAGDLRLVRDTCVKLSVLEDVVSISAIDELLSQRPRAEFTEALFQMRKAEALLALERVPESEYSRLIGKLDSDLELAGLVHDMVAERKNAGEIAKAAGKSAFLVPRIQPHAKHYGPGRRTEIRKLLSVADETLRGGQTVGVLEQVVVRW